HLPECFATPQDRQQDLRFAVDREQRFDRAGPDHEDRVAALALSDDQGAGLIRVLARRLVGDEPLASLLILYGKAGVGPEKLAPVDRLHGPPGPETRARGITTPLHKGLDVLSRVLRTLRPGPLAVKVSRAHPRGGIGPRPCSHHRRTFCRAGGKRAQCLAPEVHDEYAVS